MTEGASFFERVSQSFTIILLIYRIAIEYVKESRAQEKNVVSSN